MVLLFVNRNEHSRQTIGNSPVTYNLFNNIFILYGYKTVNIFSGTKQTIHNKVLNSQLISRYKTTFIFPGTKQTIYFRVRNNQFIFEHKTADLFSGTKQYELQNSLTFFGYETVRLRNRHFFPVTKRTGYETSGPLDV